MSFNERALKCYQKSGFKEYGRRRQCKFINGKYYDCISMDILADEFKENCIKDKNIQVKNQVRNLGSWLNFFVYIMQKIKKYDIL